MISIKLKYLENIFPKNIHSDLFFIILIASAVLIPLQVFGHGGEEVGKEVIILSRFVDGNIDVSTDSQQWTESFEKDFDSKWEHDISVKSLNNGTNVYFLLSWDDATKGDAIVKDGTLIIFESQSDNNKEGVINEVWSWDTGKFIDSTGVIVKSTWENQQWHVLFGRSVTLDQDKISFETGKKQEGFIKIVVWDGANDESIENINTEELPSADFILLPMIETYPKDVFVWSSFLIVGTISFLFVERKLHYKKEISLNE